jgi:hypothetical protein
MLGVSHACTPHRLCPRPAVCRGNMPLAYVLLCGSKVGMQMPCPFACPLQHTTYKPSSSAPKDKHKLQVSRLVQIRHIEQLCTACLCSPAPNQVQRSSQLLPRFTPVSSIACRTWNHAMSGMLSAAHRTLTCCVVTQIGCRWGSVLSGAVRSSGRWRCQVGWSCPSGTHMAQSSLHCRSCQRGHAV